MEPTFPYRVRASQRLPHHGEIFEEGTTVALTRAVAAEVRHLVDPLGADGQIVDAPTALQVELESRPAHEHEGILRRQRADLVQQLVDLTDIAQRTAATATAAAAEVARTQAAIAAIDTQLAPAPAVETPPASQKPGRKPVPEQSTTPPAPPAEKE